MTQSVPYEINGGQDAICIVGRDPGAEEVRAGRPFVGKAGRLLDDCLAEAGILRADINILNTVREKPPGNVFAAHPRALIEAEIAHLHATLRTLLPKVIVALGNEACHALVPEWPDGRSGRDLVHRGDIKGAQDIEARRGYVFDSPFAPVVATVHPAFVARTWTPWRVLLSYDLQRAKEVERNGLVRPTRNVEIVTSTLGARRAVDALRRARRFGCDIENGSDLSVSCIGFAGEGGKAYVFPPQYFDGAKALLGDAGLTAIFANGIYDLFLLRHREEWDIKARVEDVQILWHACYPELAGQKENKKQHRFTRKALAFLSSMFTFDAWWKDYNFASDQDQYILNGRDNCITLDIWNALKPVADDLNAWATYEHERSLMWPCVDMLQRGLRVNEPLRKERINALEGRIQEVASEVNRIVLPLLERERETLVEMGTLRLFEETEPTCPCCRHATKKQFRCWSCAGFEKAPTKKEMEAKWGMTGSKAELEDKLRPCQVCGGAARQTRLTYNANSPVQTKVVLYDLLKLPKRFAKNAKGESVLVADEMTLKSLLGGLPT